MTQATRLVWITAVLAAAVMVQPMTANTQADPHMGTWVLNVAKSKYTPGPPPKQQTSVYTIKGETVTVSTKGTSADGKPVSTDFSAGLDDGRDHLVKGNPDWDATQAKRVDSHTIEFTRKLKGTVVQTARSVVSKDGLTRTVTSTGVNAAGQKINNVGVYDKK